MITEIICGNNIVKNKRLKYLIEGTILKIIMNIGSYIGIGNIILNNWYIIHHSYITLAMVNTCNTSGRRNGLYHRYNRMVTFVGSQTFPYYAEGVTRWVGKQIISVLPNST